ncbi:MAG: AAA family ATPase [Parvularculaceae bacterium]
MIEDPDYEARAAFLQKEETYGAGVAAVERIDTHIATVFLAGAEAYKIKKPVDRGYLDFTTLEKRKWALERELELNRRITPEIYLDLRAIVRDSRGALRLAAVEDAGADEVVDYALHMRRFDPDCVMSRLAERGALTIEAVEAAARKAAAFHARAEIVADRRAEAAMRWLLRSNRAQFAGLPDRVFAAARWTALLERMEAEIDRLGAALARRDAHARIRLCHGDLHLGNIFVEKGEPFLFDCIEFNEEMPRIDVLYDLAFLLMDLKHRGLDDHCARALNAYFSALGRDVWRIDIEGLAALPLYMSMRAAIRAFVSAQTVLVSDSRAPDAKFAESRAYLELAWTLLDAAPPRAIAIGGLSGTGKSTVARAIAGRIPGPAGALILRTDEIRKRRAGVALDEKLPPDAYAPAESAAVYAEMFEAGRAALAAGQAVIFDAVFLRPEERAAAAAAAAGAGFAGFWLEAPAAALRARVTARRGDASDADARVVEAQLRQDAGEIDWMRIDSQSSERAAKDILTALERG